MTLQIGKDAEILLSLAAADPREATQILQSKRSD